ncbi:Chitin deacetylase [Hypsizygus marmoreus]|uniref:chitin deacetylase n=1 Tax=Hypsizygus marmoreus TaxID=39966 RepID=A0A369JUU9_HYPMA|nr:Chitin deacetylase [Hypsizygus marmoreus]
MLWSTFLLALPLIHAASIPQKYDSHDHSHDVKKRLPTAWHLPRDHPVQSLFKRGPDDGTPYPPVGSPTWSSAFPKSSPDVSQLPQPWVDALNAAVSAGKIPNIPQSTNTPGVNPVYPNGLNPNSPEICSATYKCRNTGDIWDAPDGYFGISFDDGPTFATPKLLQFLDANNETATHFMIGVNILQNPQLFLDTFNSDNDIAVHTWTHPYMTTLSNLEVVAQLGWTSEIIRNSTGGRVPRYWRPPFGDSDNRVRAIAKEVFGLETVIWNQDTEDWSLTTGGTTPEKVQASLTQWLTGPKVPGLVILEHEVSDQSVQAFIAGYPLIKPNGWKTDSLAQLVGDSVYQNSKDGASPVTFDGILASSVPSESPSSSSSSSSDTTSSDTTSSDTTSETQSSQSHSSQPTQTTTQTAGGLQASTTSNSAILSREGSWTLLALVIAAALSA